MAARGRLTVQARASGAEGDPDRVVIWRARLGDGEWTPWTEEGDPPVPLPGASAMVDLEVFHDEERARVHVLREGAGDASHVLRLDEDGMFGRRGLVQSWEITP